MTLCDAGFDHAAHLSALRAGTPRPRAGADRRTEVELFERLIASAKDRGLELLVIDEAVSLVEHGGERDLKRPLNVLRELANVASFSVLLVSTLRLLPHVVQSIEVDRRMVAPVVFPRYGGDPTDLSRLEEYRFFCRVALEMMEAVPEPLRLELDTKGFRRLYNGTLGCVGVLNEWMRRALRHCERDGASRLRMGDFRATVLNRDARARHYRAVTLNDDIVRFFGDDDLDADPSVLESASVTLRGLFSRCAELDESYLWRPVRKRKKAPAPDGSESDAGGGRRGVPKTHHR